jgi:hypothetical protein
VRAPVVLTAVPDRRRRLSEGVVVEASILARLLGIRLLRLDATVVVVPAAVTAPPSGPRDRQRLASAPRAGVPRTRSGAAGHRLADAVRSIDEGAAILAEARRTGAVG